MNQSIKLVTLLFASAFMVGCGSGETEEVTEENSEEVTEEAPAEEINYTISASSTATYAGTMVGMYTHQGNVSITEGWLTVKGGELTGGSFTVDMGSITPTDGDENYPEGKTRDMLVGHLSSPDFFDVENNPTATFTISSVSGNTATGTLNIRGTDGEAMVENVSITETDAGITATGTITFDRQGYGVAWASPMKDMVLGDDIELTINITATK